ncbi:rpsM [Acrasis kona]|uniref:RpsM n=1 Tax=Acrasis kona TaxID=1008807 RepID=A0AAW2ZMW1_9EUKA
MARLPVVRRLNRRQLIETLALRAAIEQKYARDQDHRDNSELSIRNARNSLQHLTKIRNRRNGGNNTKCLLQDLVIDLYDKLSRQIGSTTATITYSNCIRKIHSHYCGPEPLPTLQGEDLYLTIFQLILHDLQEHWYNVDGEDQSKYIIKKDQHTNYDTDSEHAHNLIHRTNLTCEEFKNKINLEVQKDFMYEFIRLRALYTYDNVDMIQSIDGTAIDPELKTALLDKLREIVNGGDQPVVPILCRTKIKVSITEDQFNELKYKMVKDFQAKRRFEQWEQFARGDKLTLVNQIRATLGDPIFKNGITCVGQNFNLMKDYFKERPGEQLTRIEKIRQIVMRCPELITLVRAVVNQDQTLYKCRPENNQMYGDMYEETMDYLETTFL